MARRFLRSEWEKYLESINDWVGYLDPNEELDVYNEYPDDGFNSYEERSLFYLKKNWEDYLNGLPSYTVDRIRCFGYMHDDLYNEKLPDHEVVRAARNICHYMINLKVKAVEYILKLLRKDVDIIADYFLVSDYSAISVALAIFNVNTYQLLGLGSFNTLLYYCFIDRTSKYEGELDDDFDHIHIEDDYFWEQQKKKTLHEFIDREIFLFYKDIPFEYTDDYLYADEYEEYMYTIGVCDYPRFNEYILTRLRDNKPFGLKMGRPSRNLSSFFDQVVECLEGLIHFKGSYSLFRQTMARLYRSNTHLLFIKYMHDNDFSLFDFCLLMMSMFYPVRNVDRYVEFLGRNVFHYVYQWEKYLEKFYSDENPMDKAGWLYFSYPRYDKVVRCHLNFGKIVEQGLILPIKDRPGNRYKVSYVYDFNWY